VTLKDTFICRKLWYEYKVMRIEVLILEKLLVLNSFGLFVCSSW